MNLPPISYPSTVIDLARWRLEGSSLLERRVLLRDLQGVFGDHGAYSVMDPGILVYEVQVHVPVPEGTPGGLFFGTTVLQPGKVGDEYFMTRGHAHAKEECGEYYWCIRGAGALILMKNGREMRAEQLVPGSLHFVPGFTAHRLANTGTSQLVVGACWPSDAGHNYEVIARAGFPARLVDMNGTPRLLE